MAAYQMQRSQGPQRRQRTDDRDKDKETTTTTAARTAIEMPRCLVPPPRYCPPHLAPNLRLLSSGAGVKWLPTDFHSSLQLCQVLLSKGVR